MRVPSVFLTVLPAFLVTSRLALAFASDIDASIPAPVLEFTNHGDLYSAHVEAGTAPNTAARHTGRAIPRWMSNDEEPSAQKRHRRRAIVARASPVPGNPGTPSVPVTAKIQARGMDGSLLGWVASDLQEYAGIYTITSLKTRAAVVIFDSSMTAANPGNLAIQGKAAFPNIGGILGDKNVDGDIAPRTYNYGYLAQVPSTEAHSTPQALVNSRTAPQTRALASAIWSYDITTTKLTPASWVNADLSTVPASLMLVSERLDFTGDIALFKKQYGGVPVEFFAVLQ